jgi:hypothetical protein
LRVAITISGKGRFQPQKFGYAGVVRNPLYWAYGDAREERTSRHKPMHIHPVGDLSASENYA